MPGNDPIEAAPLPKKSLEALVGCKTEGDRRTD